MPKLKTHRGAAKRFRKTATGKFKRSRAFHSHLLSKKSSRRKRRLLKPAYVKSTEAKKLKRLLPY
ncbi:50S ribosomal protein L35 [Desulfovirgula thermocuniculi]|uniref:50S ribosomal protein L35 n=1 Tax=Desulfovirgula thermocuniculi TaxID=348842 RepID=UPI000425E554|nr:50S ribosomal protein L35 [Desulfovirgula thermocuniculi]